MFYVLFALIVIILPQIKHLVNTTPLAQGCVYIFWPLGIKSDLACFHTWGRGVGVLF